MSTQFGQIGRHKFHGAPGRFEAVADYIAQNYTGKVRRVADAAGGQGMLCRILKKKYNFECEVLDPRGNTLVGVEARKEKYLAEDADLIEGLHGWYNWKKEKVKFPDNAGPEFLDNHEFIWDREYLEQYLKENPNVYLFGLSNNVLEMRDLFDEAYYLYLDSNKLKERLISNERENPMGKTQYQQQMVINYKEKLDQKAKSLGLKFIDATLTADQILNLIK